MEKTPIYSSAGPVEGAPYTPGVRAGDFVFISGQVPLDPTTSRLVEGDFETQVHQCMTNLKRILEQGGLTLADVVKCTVFLADLNNFAKLNQVYGSYFTGIRPARSCVQVARLPLDAEVEIEAIAIAP